jgi:hypothetical protein
MKSDQTISGCGAPQSRGPASKDVRPICLAASQITADNEPAEHSSKSHSAANSSSRTRGQNSRLATVLSAPQVSDRAGHDREGETGQLNGKDSVTFPSLKGCRNRLWRIRKASDPPGPKKPLTAVDTEHGFVGNLKAWRARIFGVFGLGR